LSFDNRKPGVPVPAQHKAIHPLLAIYFTRSKHLIGIAVVALHPVLPLKKQFE